MQPLSEPQTPPHSQCTHTGHTVTVAAVCLVGSRPSSGAPGAERARVLQQALLQGWRAPTVLPTPSTCLSARPRPAPHTHWSLWTGQLLLEGSSAYLEGMPTLPAWQNMVLLAPLSTLPPALGVLGGATQRGCSGERLSVGSVHAAEGLGCLPRGQLLPSRCGPTHGLWWG